MGNEKIACSSAVGEDEARLASGGIKVERKGDAGFWVHYDFDRYQLDPELIEDLGNAIARDSGFSVWVNRKYVFMGMLEVFLNPTKRIPDVVIDEIIAKVVAAIQDSEV